MNRAKLVLLACPAVLASMLLATNPVQANEQETQPTTNTEVSAPAKPIVEIVFEQPNLEPPMLEFTEEESDKAIELYACDCTGCINAVRQLQGQLPLGQG